MIRIIIGVYTDKTSRYYNRNHENMSLYFLCVGFLLKKTKFLRFSKSGHCRPVKHVVVFLYKNKRYSKF